MEHKPILFSDKEAQLLEALIDEGIEILEAIKDAKMEEADTGRLEDIGRGFEDFLQLCGDEEVDQIVLEGIKHKLGGEM